MAEVPTLWIRCKVLLGMFSTERLVMIEPARGESVSMFVDETLVRAEETPSDDNPVDGSVRVWKSRENGKEVTVMLPVSTNNRGQFISVPIEALAS